MKQYILGLSAALVQLAAAAQCGTPVVTLSGPTTFCTGGSVTLSTLVNTTANTWTQKASFGGGVRAGATGLSIGNKGYMGLGYDLYGEKKDFWEYDPATNAWTQKADYSGTARYGASGFSIGTKGYVGLGFSSTVLTDFWQYDPTTNAWTQKNNFGGAGRYGAAVFTMGSKAYVGTGSGVDVSNLKDLWEYNPATDTWTKKADFGGTARYLAAGFSIGTKGYIGTGDDGTFPNVNNRKDFWEYNPVTDTWVQKADFAGTARYAAFSFSLGNRGYVGAGDQGPSSMANDFWEYNAANDTWTKKADFGGGGLDQGVGFTINGRGYVGTGLDGHSPFTSSFWSYDPGPAYLWSNGATTPSITVTESGSYTVTITADGCTGTSDPIVVNSTTLHWVLDNDKDSYYSGSTVTQCASPGAGYAVKTTQQAGDCDDNDSTVYPGAPDICDGKDNDCNGGVDDDFRYQKKYYRDSDGDGFGYSQDFVLNCSPVFGRVTVDGDCDDNNAAVNPGATEVCGNNKDDNCNGTTDEGCSTTAVTSFTLVNATSDKDIKTLTNGAVIDLATIAGKAINIRANTSPAKVGSVKLVLTGKQSKTQTDNALPYALFSDNSGNYNSWQPDPGSYTLKATPYAGSNGTGTSGASLTLSFTVVDNTPKISGFVLVNATSDKDIKTLTNGAVIDLAVTPAINIRANPVGNVGSVRFALNSTVNYKTENTAPFSIGSNSGGDYSNWNIAPGTYTLKATPYSADNAGGTAGTPSTITITVKRSLSTRPAITTTEAGSEDNKVAENKSWGMSLYPNPTSGHITINLQVGAIEGTIRIELLDLWGRTMSVESGTLVKGTLRKQMQIPSAAAAGVYMLRLTTGNHVYQTKLVYTKP